MKMDNKAIENLVRFILIINRKTEYSNLYEPIEVIKLESCGIIEAMYESEKYIDDTVYLINIAEKTNEVINNEMIVYKEILTNKGTGWHACDKDHGEQQYKHGYNVEFNYFENLGQIK